MKIPELVELINEFAYNDQLTEKEKKSNASGIKRQYLMIIQELRKKDRRIALQDLRKMFRPLLDNYENIKEYSAINEVLQLMAEEIKESKVTNLKDRENMENEIATIYTSILGNIGTSTKGMSSEYISKIIAKKVPNEEGMNREDIINLLISQSKKMYVDIDQFQKLINDSVITFLTNAPNGEKFTNPKIFEVFESFAASYKVKGDFNKVEEIYKQALKITSLKETIEYQEIKKNYEKFLDYMEMKSDFEDKRFNSFENLISSLKATYSPEEIFVKGTRKKYGPRVDKPTAVRTNNYVMPVNKKLEGLERLLKSLKRENDNYDILEYEEGKNLYNGYIIFKIKDANVSILENFTEVNARIFIVKNEMIDQVRLLTKNDAVALEGVEAANHVENFDNYCRNLIRKTKKLIRETQIGLEPPTEDELTFVNEDFNMQDVESSERKEIDKVELERKKAFEHRKKLQELEKRLENIQKETAEKISKVKNESEQGQE